MLWNQPGLLLVIHLTCRKFGKSKFDQVGELPFSSLCLPSHKKSDFFLSKEKSNSRTPTQDLITDAQRLSIKEAAKTEDEKRNPEATYDESRNRSHGSNDKCKALAEAVPRSQVASRREARCSEAAHQRDV